MATSDKERTSEDRHKDFIDGTKQGYDFFKHMTTLSTASVLLLSTLLEKFFSSPSWSILIGATFAGFIVSLIFSLIAMYFLTIVVAKAGDIKEQTSTLGIIGVIGSIGGFLFGIVALTIFTLKNFYT